MRLCGTEVTTPDCNLIIDALNRVGRDADLALAQRIDRGLEREVRILGLSPAERDLLLSVLDDSLAELRGQLARE